MSRSFKNAVQIFAAVLLSSSLLLTSQPADAFPLTSGRSWNPAFSASLTADGFPYNGIIALSNCSGSLVKFKGASADSMGLILTNGHCTGGMFGGMPGPGEIIYKKPQTFRVKLLNQDGSVRTSLRATEILYATMTDTDAALLKLNQTYKQIEAASGVKPLLLADQMPIIGSKIDIPSGYWTRTYSCQIESVIHQLKEGRWTFTNSVRYSAVGCEVIGGTSGSPIVSPVSGEVIAINNTGNEDGETCTVNNPCEVDTAGNVKVIQGRGYGQQIYMFYSCLNAAAELDLDTSGCSLPKGH